MRTRILSAALLGGSAWAVLATAASAAGADQPSTPSPTVGEVVVTARRTAEPLQKTPVSVTAISQAQLDAQGARNTTDLQGVAPNMNIVQGRGQSDATNIYIRGVGQPDALQTFDPAVGVYVDDVFFPRIVGSMFDLLDLKDVEVLRGPQGTLYGKNTIAGAIKIDTEQPGQAVRAGLDLSYGDYNSITARGFLMGPVSNTLSLGVSALSETHDGYVKDTLNGRTYNDQDTQSFRAQAVWRPASNFTLALSADYAMEHPHLTAGQPTSTLSNAFGIPLDVITTVPQWDWKAQLGASLPNKQPLMSNGASAVATWDLNSNLTLKSITSFRHLQYDYFIDIDATPLQIGDVQVAVHDNTFSQEGQLDFKGGPWNVVAGVYYMHEHIVSAQDAYANDYVANPFPVFAASTFLRTISDDLTTDSLAGYGNAIYAVTDRLHLSAGVRVTEETKTYAFTTSTFSDNPIFDGTYTPAFQQDPKTWTNVSPMASADFQIGPTAMVYARFAEGFQSGGFNGRSDSASTGTLPYGPETLYSYEVGAKTDWFEHRLRLNGDVFYNDYRNFQASVGTFQPGPGGVNTAVNTVVNAGGLDIKGAELELTAAPTSQLRFDAEIGYLDARYSKFVDTTYITPANPTGSRTWETPAFSPKWTIRLGASYTWENILGGRVTLSDQARYHSTMALAVDNSTVAQQPYPGMWQAGYWVDDAQLVWDSRDSHYSLGVYAKNIADTAYRTDAENFYTVGGIMTAYYGDPRTYNVTFRYRY